MVPTEKTALFTGAWSMFGLVPFDIWMGSRHFSIMEKNVFWVIAMLLFFIVPFYFFVIGREAAPFSRAWFMDADERARYWVVSKRMLCWFLSAAVFGTFWSLLLTAFL